MIAIILYLIIVNIVAFARMGGDKRAAQARPMRRRVPERSLFLTAAIGGALGIWAGMRLFRHKTKHASFIYGIPALFALNVACLWLLLRAL